MKQTALIAAGVVALVAAPSAGAASVEHQVIVKYAPSASSVARTAAAKAAGVVARVGSIQATGAQVVRVAGSASTAAAALNRLSAVQYAEVDKVLTATAIPNDARFGELYGLNNANDADLDAPEGWDLAGLGALPATGGVKVGIVDTGIDKTHEDLAGHTVDCGGVKNFGFLGLFGGDPTIVDNGNCTDDNDHGSHVAGTIAATANNGVGVAGVSFNSPLSICKALSSSGSGSTSGVANCITYLKNKGAKVISMSLGGGSSTTLQQAVTGAWANGNGSLIIAAAGNDGNSTLNYPAAYPEVVSVAATDRNDQRASFSNANADVEIAAAGVDVLSVKRGGGYQLLSGTSMATPHVSGVAALIAFRNPGFTAAQIRSKLDAAVDDLGTPGRDTSFGFGRVNLVKALS